MTTKKELREKYKNLRKELTPVQRDEMSLEIANQALSLDIWNYKYYHIFLPIERLKEVDTQYLLSVLGGKDKNVVISTADFTHTTMTHYLLTDSTKIVLNKYGIPEPEEGIEIAATKLDVVFIPLLAYDKQGNRIGYGKGFYDRFLAQCRPDVLKVGISYFEPSAHLIDTNTQDIGLNYCISPKKVFDF